MAYYVLAKYGEISHMTTFRSELVDLKRGDEVILRSERGTEFGIVVNPPFESDDPPAAGVSGEILRRLTSEDEARVNRIDEVDRPAEIKFCGERIAFHKLPMKLVDVEHLFGGEKIIYYFLADGRVDFRQLVKDLAKEYRTRIELKQIGVRDEARLLADYDHCGREICCRTFIRDLQPVTMKMAKAQKATLDPTKISGRCGRLMCCLRYEDKVYEEMKKKLPRKGARIVTDHGTAEVIDYDVISQTLRVETQEGRIIKVLMTEVKEIIPRDEKEYQRRQQERAQQRGKQSDGSSTDVSQKRSSRPRRDRGKQRADQGGGQGRAPDRAGADTGPGGRDGSARANDGQNADRGSDASNMDRPSSGDPSGSEGSPHP